jgi:hypothetical protein
VLFRRAAMLQSFWLMFVLSGDVSKVANNCQSPVTSFYYYLFLLLAATLRYSAFQRKHNRFPDPRTYIKTCHVTGYLQIRTCDNSYLTMRCPRLNVVSLCVKNYDKHPLFIRLVKINHAAIPIMKTCITTRRVNTI